MCGISAIFAYNGAAPGVDNGELCAIRDYMTPRGPDGAGEWYSTDKRVGLAHRRLSIIDLSPGGAQPMLSPERQLAITFNGEIYNYRELRALLEKKGHVFKSASDTEVLLRLYAERGPAMVEELRGMYAFALWDGERKGLLLGRDPFGIKPLYCADDGKTFRAASQVKALLAGGKIEIQPDPAGHVGFFLWGHMPEPYTLYKTIRSLPAGTTLWIDTNGARQQKTFSSITEIFSQAERASHSLAGHADGLLASGIRESVKYHLVSDVPVGVFLSSGLDSTTQAALAAEQGGILRTVTLGFDEYRGTKNDEIPLAETVARQYGAKHQTIWVTREDFRAQVGQLFNAMDQPTTDGVNTYFVSFAAKRAGLKVALSGLGGDELFGGYPSFTQVPRVAGALRFLPPSNGIGKTFRVVSAPLVKRLTSPKYAGLLEFGGSYSGAYLLRRGMFMPWELPEILDPEIVRQGWAELQPLARLDETLNGLGTPRAKVSCLEMCWYMRNQLLRDSDWAGMAHSLEIRVPLVDVTLLQSIAPLLVSKTPPTKRDMAFTPRSGLPVAVLNRAKTGFQVPVREWLLQENPKSTDRGLRGWSKCVYQRFAGADGFVRTKRSRSISNLSSPISSPSPGFRILVLVTDAFGSHGGIAKFNRDLLSALCANPDVEQVVALPRLMPEPPGELPAKLRYVTSGVGSKLRYIKTVLATILRSPASDVLICGHINLLPITWLAQRLIRKADTRNQGKERKTLQSPSESSPLPDFCPLLLVVHGIDAWQPTRSRLVNQLAGKIDAFISVSEFTKERFLSWTQLNGIRSFILPNCVDLARFTPGPKNTQLLKRYGLSNSTVLLTVSRLSAQEQGWKGIDDVLEVLPELAKKVPNLSYFIVGDGTDRARLEEKASKLGIRDRVIFAGHISEQEKAEYYRLADAFVLAGREEGFGIVYLEAMACGLRVVGSKADASRETLRNGELGIIVDPNNRNELCEGILNALGSVNRVVPAGLDFFSIPNFNRRCHQIIHSLKSPVVPR